MDELDILHADPAAPDIPARPAPVSASAAAAADLRAWWEAHLRNTAISRNTPVYNRVSGLIADVLTILDGLKE